MLGANENGVFDATAGTVLRSAFFCCSFSFFLGLHFGERLDFIPLLDLHPLI